MMKYTIAHYQKSNSMWMTNGGKLIVTDNEYIVKYLFQTVVRFKAPKTLISPISNTMLYSGFRFDDGEKSIDLYFFPKTATKLRKHFNV